VNDVTIVDEVAALVAALRRAPASQGEDLRRAEEAVEAIIVEMHIAIPIDVNIKPMTPAAGRFR
jgi:hypothetical protein